MLLHAKEYQDIANKLIDKFPVAFGHIMKDKVLYLKNTDKKTNKYADCRIVREPYTYMTDYKFIITFYEVNMLALTEAQKVMVVYHELLHIHEDFDKLVKHDLEDFLIICQKYSPSWSIDPNLPNILEDEDNPTPVVDEDEIDIL